METVSSPIVNGIQIQFVDLGNRCTFIVIVKSLNVLNKQFKTSIKIIKIKFKN